MTRQPARHLRLSSRLVVFLLMVALPSPLLSQGGQGSASPDAERFPVTRASGPVVVDGVLDEAAWAAATPIPLPYEWLPGDNVPPPVETEVRVIFDEENLYLGFLARDPVPGEIRANLADRDTPFQDDHVGFMIDPFNDERRGFQFRINPLGVQMDANFSENEGYEDFSWDAIWDSDGQITEEGYVVEVAIPFKSLRFPRATEPQTWGFMAFRSYPRDVRHRIRSHLTDRDRACLLCQMNKIEGIQGVDPGMNVEVTPTLTAVRTDTRPEWPEGSWDSGEGDYEPGVTARWSMTPNLVFNGTVNPDFSQVEADVAQLDVNNRFALFFPERRPFFLEGADFFLTPMNVIFTRTVANPRAGAKVTGKEGPHAIGFFLTQDRVNNLVFPSNQGSRSFSVDEDITAGVLRYRRDVGEGSTVGGLATARVGDGYQNWVYGADAFLRLSQTKVLEVQYLRSSTEYPGDLPTGYGQPDGSFSGDAVLVTARHQSREWAVNGGFSQIGKDFRADAGFMPRVDTRSYEGVVLRTFWGEPGDWYSLLRAGVMGGRTEDLDGELSEQQAQLFGTFAGAMQSNLTAYVTAQEEFFAGETFQIAGLGWNAEIRPSGAATLNFNGYAGNTVDYTNAREGTLLNLSPRAELKLGRHLNISLQHAYQRLEHGGKKTFVANLSQVRAVYNLNVRTFFRAIVQYQDVDRNVEEYLSSVSPETQTVFTQFLFSYKVNPQTVLFLGYSDNAYGLLTPELVRTDLTRTDRTFFLKLGYAWRP
ncbi:carbohydrate binding family 9 domain-containing protein [Gemmatimonadota bacterium]